ncbi:MAG: cell division protein FtsB [Verrucomicrobiales bacterium]|jgi:cell division protein FtsB
MNARHDDPEATDELDIWQRASRVLTYMLVFAGIAVACVLFWPEIERLEKIGDGNSKLEAEVAMLEAERDAVKQEFQWLRDDPEYLELVARDRLNLQKDGETVFRIKREEEAR